MITLELVHHTSWDDWFNDLVKRTEEHSNSIDVSYQLIKLFKNYEQTYNHHAYWIRDQVGSYIGSLWYETSFDGTAHLHDIFIEPEFRNKGYGRAAIYTVINELATAGKDQGRDYHLTLTVREDNERAIKLYEELGFNWTARVGELKITSKS